MTTEFRRSRSGRGRPRVVCVDDEPLILQILRRLLDVQGFEPITFEDPLVALAEVDFGGVDLVVTDIHMPGMDGLTLMREVRERQPDLPVVIVTGHGTVDTAIRALREGASGMLVKPFTGEELLAEARRALAASELRYEALQFRYLSPVLDSIALTLSTAIEARNLETGEHCRQLGVLSERMAVVLGLDEREQMTVRIGGYLHDIGKIGIADAVLLKPGKLTEEEMAEMRRHSEIGATILEVHEAMSDIGQIVRHHHERWDGLGYPGGLAGAAIPLGGRIIAVADAFSAMTSDRIYRPALPLDRAWAELRAHSGTQFDPDIVAAFERVVDEEGKLRPLGGGAEEALDGPLHVPLAVSDDWRSRMASLPAGLFEPPGLSVATALPEPCPVAPAGEDCAVTTSGEGCEKVRPAVGSAVGSTPSDAALESRAPLTPAGAASLASEVARRIAEAARRGDGRTGSDGS